MMNGIKSCYTCYTYTTCGDVKCTVMKRFGLCRDYRDYYHLYECIITGKRREKVV